MATKFTISLLTLFHYVNARLRGFLSIDIDVSQLYINQCDIKYLEFHSASRHSNFRNNKFPSIQEHQQQFPMNQYVSHQLTPLQPQLTFHSDNEIDAFHSSHKCHRGSMDVRDVAEYFNLFFHYIRLFLLSSSFRRLVPVPAAISEQ